MTYVLNFLKPKLGEMSDTDNNSVAHLFTYYDVFENAGHRGIISTYKFCSQAIFMIFSHKLFAI